jgi:hypothetical protein
MSAGKRMIEQTGNGCIAVITQGGVDLCEPCEPSAGQVERYGVFIPFQIGPNTAAAICNRRTIGEGHWDYEDGSDLLIFDNLNTLGKLPTTVLTANEQEPDQETGGTRVIVKYPLNCGFIPLGALNQSGSIHPYAGTGFGNCVTLSYLIDDTGYYDWHQKGIHRIECRQFTYDGTAFRVDHLATYSETNPLRIGKSEWIIRNNGLSVPLPDGDDLLAPLVARRTGGEVSGVCRWRREAAYWHPMDFSPVVEGYEPSLVRDIDDTFLFSARGRDQRIRVWHSSDNGRTWAKIIDIHNGTGPGPVSINRTVDGIPYIAANSPGSFRAKLCMWPLNQDRTGLLASIMIRDCEADFGPPPGDARWFADHPISSILRLSDGMFHNILAYRVMAFSTTGRGKEIITPATGTYIEEVRSMGSCLPLWENRGCIRR